MNKAQIRFFNADITFDFKNKRKISASLLNYSKENLIEAGEINYVFCTDEFLLDLNKKFLNHDYYTDIISFQSEKDPIGGDIYISLDRVRDNAKNLKLKFQDELLRIISHGLLHFMGFNDKTKADQSLMRSKEDELILKIKEAIA